MAKNKSASKFPTWVWVLTFLGGVAPLLLGGMIIDGLLNAGLWFLIAWFISGLVKKFRKKKQSPTEIMQSNPQDPPSFFCSACGSKQNENANFCHNCGYSF
jgi:hypothetical protein